MGRGESKCRRGGRLNRSQSRSPCCVPPDLVWLHSCCGAETGTPGGVLSPRWESVDSSAASPPDPPPTTCCCLQTQVKPHRPQTLMVIHPSFYLLSFFKRFYWSIVDLQCVHLYCTTTWFRSTYTCCSIMAYHRILNTFLVLYSTALSFIHALYSSLHLLIPNSHQFPTPPPPLSWQPQVLRTFVF